MIKNCDDLSLDIPPHSTRIVKMHGCLNAPNNIVISVQDYDEYLSKNPIFVTHLANLFITRTPLFVGYSRRDPHFRHIRWLVRQQLGSFARQAFLVNPNMSEWEEKILRADGITPINLPLEQGEQYGEVLKIYFDRVSEELEKSGAIESVRKESHHEEHGDDEDSKKLIQQASPDTISSILIATSNYCYVSGSEDESEKLVEKIIKPSIDDMGFDIKYPSSFVSSIDEIRILIQQAKLVIAIIKTENKATAYDTGIAVMLKKPLVIVAMKGIRLDSLLPKDVYDAIKANRIPVVRVSTIFKPSKLIDEISKAVKQVFAPFSLLGIERELDEQNYLDVTLRLVIVLDFLIRSLGKKHDIIQKRVDVFPKIVHKLQRLDIITHDELESLLWARKLRNGIIHNNKIPSEESTRRLMEFSKQFIETHFQDNYSEIIIQKQEI